jgi:fibronectin-binding autotransporter adhesin
MIFRLRHAVVVLFFALLGGTGHQQAQAAPYTWDASGGSPLDDGSGSWNASGGTNWFDGTTYGAWGNTNADTAFFGVASGAAGTVTVGAVTANGITFNAAGSGNYTLSSGTITLAGTTPTITVNASGTSTISSVIAGSAGFTKTGTGTLTLGTANTYTGTTTINQGTVRALFQAGGLGAGTTGSVVLNGGGLVLSNASNYAPTWNISIGANGGTFQEGSGARWTIGTSITGTGTLTLASLAGGANRFVNAGLTNFGGKLVLSGVLLDDPHKSLGTATGDDAITLINSASMSTWVTVSGGTIGSSAQGITLASSGAIGQSGNSAGAVVIAAKISGAGALTLSPNSNALTTGTTRSLTLSNSANSWSGGLTITDGGTGFADVAPVRLGASEVIPNGAGKGDVAINAAMTPLDLNGFNETINGLTANTAAGYVDNRAASTAAVLTVGDNNATTTFQGGLRNSGSNASLALVKIGTGTLTLSGSSSFSGGTTIRTGAITVSSTAALGTGGIVLSGSTSRPTLNLGADVTGVTMTLDGTLQRPVINATGSGTRTWNGSVVLTGTATADGAPQFVSDSVPMTILGTITGSNGGQGLLFRGPNAAATLGATVSIGSSSFTKADSGRWTITSAGNQWGTTTISGGALRAGINNALPTTTAVTLGSGFNAALELNSFDVEIGSLSGGATDGTVTLGSGRLTFGGANTSTTFSGVISGSGGRIRKIGTGTQTLSAANTYTGDTTISAGILALASAGSIANSSVITIGDAGSSGAILDLTAKTGTFTFGVGQTVSGIGTIDIGAGKTVAILGTLAPGNSPGLLSITGDLLLGAASTTVMEIDGLVRGTGYDASGVSGLLTYGGSMNLTFGSLFADGASFDLFDFASQTGDFSSIIASGSYSATLASNGSGVWTGLAANGQTLTFTQSDGVLTFLAVPEPTTATCAAIGFMLVGWSMRRRRRPARRSE